MAGSVPAIDVFFGCHARASGYPLEHDPEKWIPVSEKIMLH
jgi:hypothetical protein